MPMVMTEAQLRAVAWLDASWKIRPGRLVAALNSLSLFYPGHVEAQWGDFGPRGGREQRWRLTDVGMALKARAIHIHHANAP